MISDIHGNKTALDADYFAGGHTHRQMIRPFRDGFIINPGSVGAVFSYQPDDNGAPRIIPRAEYATIESCSDGVRIQLHRTSFDVSEYKRVLESSDIPTREWWLSQYE